MFFFFVAWSKTDTQQSSQQQNLGRTFLDIMDVIVAGVSCKSTLAYIDATHITCSTGMFPHPENPFLGEVYVVTASGGSGQNHQGVSFRYNAGQCLLLTHDKHPDPTLRSLNNSSPHSSNYCGYLPPEWTGDWLHLCSNSWK